MLLFKATFIKNLIIRLFRTQTFVPYFDVPLYGGICRWKFGTASAPTTKMIGVQNFLL